MQNSVKAAIAVAGLLTAPVLTACGDIENPKSTTPASASSVEVQFRQKPIGQTSSQTLLDSLNKAGRVQKASSMMASICR